jgi:hypothetical protein
MDVSRSEAQRAETNVIARSVDNGCRRFLKVAARSSLRAITFAPKLRCAPFFRSHPSPLHLLTSTSVVAARSSLRAITFAPKLRCAPFFRSHPSPLLRLTSISGVVAVFVAVFVAASDLSNTAFVNRFGRKSLINVRNALRHSRLYHPKNMLMFCSKHTYVFGRT